MWCFRKCKKNAKENANDHFAFLKNAKVFQKDYLFWIWIWLVLSRFLNNHLFFFGMAIMGQSMISFLFKLFLRLSTNGQLKTTAKEQKKKNNKNASAWESHISRFATMPWLFEMMCHNKQVQTLDLLFCNAMFGLGHTILYVLDLYTVIYIITSLKNRIELARVFSQRHAMNPGTSHICSSRQIP